MENRQSFGKEIADMRRLKKKKKIISNKQINGGGDSHTHTPPVHTHTHTHTARTFAHHIL